MKKFIVLIANISLTFLFFNVYPQITIDDNDMPYINDTFRMSSTTVFSHDPDSSGENFYWDYRDLAFASQYVDTFIAVSSTPLIYNFVFGSYFDPNKATIAQPSQSGTFQIMNIQVSYEYDFYRETSAKFSKQGFGAKINGFSLPLKYDNPELLYSFPLQMGNMDSSVSVYGADIPSLGYYGQTIKRVNTVDGWGTLETPFGSFQTMRVRSLVYITDTIYYDSMSFGISIPRLPETEYKWLGDNKGIPLLQVNKTTLTTEVLYQDSARMILISSEGEKFNREDIIAYPNPSGDIVSFQNIPDDCRIEISDVLGNKIYENSNIQYVDISGWSKGVYIMRITDRKNNMLKATKIIKE